MILPIDQLLLCSFESDIDINDVDEHIKYLWNGEWQNLFKHSPFRNAKRRDDIICLINSIKDKDDPAFYKILSCGVASVSAFCELHWTGPNSNEAEKIMNQFLLSVYETCESSKSNEECYATIHHMALLYFAIDVFENLLQHSNELITLWWKLRCYVLYQHILDEYSPRVLSIIEATLNSLSSLDHQLNNNSDLETLLWIEMSQAYLFYGKVHDSENCLKKASSICGLSLHLKGALGRRTKFQEKAVAQLGVEVTISDTYNRKDASVTHSTTVLPNPLNLNDDVRLENIQFLDSTDNSNPILTSLEQALCIATIQNIQRSQPKDELANEEIIPYINLLLAQRNGPWSIRTNTFLIKCLLESKNKRTVERSMMQCEQIVNNYNMSQPNICCRLSYLWASGLPPYVHRKSLLGDLLLSLGLVKAALDIFLNIQLWEEVIACYTILELRHKAAEIICQQIEIKPTAKLYCLLGDATDDPSQYEKAWKFSNEKSSKAQRHWGNYLFSHKKYSECIPHYIKSCDINSLQESVWLRLGYAALMEEQWDIAANAYRRYTYLEPHSFEAWNNLAKVYVKQGNKERAYKALCETLKYNFDNWQVWENMLVVSMDTGHIDDVIHSYHRLLDLKKKHLDVEVLTLLVKNILQLNENQDEDHNRRITSKALELFGRLTSVYPTEASIWQLYADLSPNILLKGQRLMKTFSAITTQNTFWVNDETKAGEIISLVESLGSVTLQCVDRIDGLEKNQVWQLVSSARLSTQAVIRAVANQKYKGFNDKLNILQDFLQNLTSALQKR